MVLTRERPQRKWLTLQQRPASFLEKLLFNKKSDFTRSAGRTRRQRPSWCGLSPADPWLHYNAGSRPIREQEGANQSVAAVQPLGQVLVLHIWPREFHQLTKHSLSGGGATAGWWMNTNMTDTRVWVHPVVFGSVSVHQLKNQNSGFGASSWFPD